MYSLLDIELSDRDFTTVRSMIYELAGISLGESKRIMVQGRLAKRLRKLELATYSDYIAYLQGPLGKDEVTPFINALTTNKTEFFREQHHFDFLASNAFPEMLRAAQRGAEKKLRIWCSAASTGEEPYTIAMAVREAFGAAFGWDIKLLASDIDTDVLRAAEQGIYPAERLEGLPAGLKQKYFQRLSKTDENYQVKPLIRELLSFRRINLNERTWPIQTSFDIIFCRNVLIYFDAKTQSSIIEHFGKYLRKDGYLIIGHSESIQGLSDQFKSLGNTVYQKIAEDATLRYKSQELSLGGFGAGIPRRSLSTTGPSATCVAQVARPAGGLPSSSPRSDEPIKSIIVGEVCVSDKPLWITTVLGSCVAVCLFDATTGVAGMNHFMLPTSGRDADTSTRYGVHSMEVLINSLVKLGAARKRLQAKVFGGGILEGSHPASIGEGNTQFALGFLKRAEIPVLSNFTQQDRGMFVQFHTTTLKALVRLLDRQAVADATRHDAQSFHNVQTALDRVEHPLLVEPFRTPQT